MRFGVLGAVMAACAVVGVQALAPRTGLVVQHRGAFGVGQSLVSAPRLQTPLRMARGDEPVPFDVRVLATVPYILPILDGLQSGTYVYRALPQVGDAVYTVFGAPLAVWTGVPFLGFGVFLAFSVAARNMELPRLVRFNFQQAIILDISLIVLNLLQNVTKGLSPGAAESLTTLQFYCLVSSVAYALFANLQGKVPNQIPIVSEAAERSIGPF